MYFVDVYWQTFLQSATDNEPRCRLVTVDKTHWCWSPTFC